jgi:hypothetical protein
MQLPPARNGPPDRPLLQVTQIALTGSWTDSASRSAIELAMGGCAQLKAVMRQALLDQV